MYVEKLTGEHATHDVTHWAERFINLAEHISSWSKDPSTKVGAVITHDLSHKLISIGFNGFPPSIQDKEEWLNHRETKYRYVIHAEMNAIFNAAAPLDNCSLFLYPLFPCPECAKHVAATSIKKVYFKLGETSSPYLKLLPETVDVFQKANILLYQVKDGDAQNRNVSPRHTEPVQERF